MASSIFTSPLQIFLLATLLRLILFLWGLYQDAHSPLKYTDIDYYVFTDASRFISHSLSPYQRETYRYTPLLAWLLYPTTFPGTYWFSFGKILFALSDLIAGWLILVILKSEHGGMSTERALKFASIWLLNPMVATISTRGSSEGLLGVMVVALLWAITQRRIAVAGVLLGLSVHFKIYPFIYAASIVWWMDAENLGLAVSEKGSGKGKGKGLVELVKEFCNAERIKLTVMSLATFMGLNILMYSIYGPPFLQHTYLHHITRIDHRHNFSPYNTLLYLSSSSSTPSKWHLESLAFIPQLLLSTFLIPFLLAKKDLPSTMLAQTFAFVSFNKVCTSQYFLWYTIFLPFYLPRSTLLSSPKTGFLAATLWIGAQALWLQQGFQLEFMGASTFVPGLWVAGVGLFVVNCWILGVIVGDVGAGLGRDGGLGIGKGKGKGEVGRGGEGRGMEKGKKVVSGR